MSRAENRTHCVEKIIRFTPDEWERVRKLYEELTRYAPEHRSFSSYARRMLSERRIHVTEVRPLTDPEPLAREIDRRGIGGDRVLFATDQPWGDFAGEYHRVLGAATGSELSAAVFADTFDRLYG